MKAFRLMKTEGTIISGTGVELTFEKEGPGEIQLVVNYFLIFSRIGMI